MKSIFFRVAVVVMCFLGNSAFGQIIPKEKLLLEVRCYEQHFTVKKGEPSSVPNFILAIKNNGVSNVSLKQQVLIGHHGDKMNSDITFQLEYLTEFDTVNVLKIVTNESLYRPRQNNILTIYAGASYYFEFSKLSPIYFSKTGKYRIKFTLLKKYSEQYLSKDIDTDWKYFDVIVTRNDEILR